jgi:hypothetical protein
MLFSEANVFLFANGEERASCGITGTIVTPGEADALYSGRNQASSSAFFP